MEHAADNLMKEPVLIQPPLILPQCMSVLINALLSVWKNANRNVRKTVPENAIKQLVINRAAAKNVRMREHVTQQNVINQNAIKIL